MNQPNPPTTDDELKTDNEWRKVRRFIIPFHSVHSGKTASGEGLYAKDQTFPYDDEDSNKDYSDSIAGDLLENMVEDIERDNLHGRIEDL